MAATSFQTLEASVKAASPFKDIEFNFRDLHLVNPRIKQDRLFRSATPSALNGPQLSILLNDLHVKTILDLRTLQETVHDPGPQLVHHVFARAPEVHEVALDKLEASADFAMFQQQLDELSVTPLAAQPKLERSTTLKTSRARRTDSQDDNLNQGVAEVQSADWQGAHGQAGTVSDAPLAATQNTAYSQQQIAAALELCNCYGAAGGRLKYFIPLAERSVMTKALIHSISWRERLHVAGRYFLGVTWDSEYKNEAKDYMLQHFDSLGLVGLNKIILTYSTHMLSRALKIIAVAAHQPVLFHCFHGKDRTGLVSALVLALLHTPRDDIANDYHLSEVHGSSALGRAQFEKIPQLTVDNWCKAPKEVIKETLEWIDVEHGGVEQYMASVLGFNAEWQAKLIAALTD